MDILRTPFYEEVPLAFLYENANGIQQLVGPYAQIIKHFADYKNYTLELVSEENYKVSDVQRKIERNFYNISMHGSTYRNQFANIAFSYPLEWSKICIMVPAEEELPRYWYVVWPFGPYIWTFLAVTVIYVAVVMKYLKHPTTSFMDNLMHSLPLVMYSSNTNLRLTNLTLRLQWFYYLVLVMGFIFSSYYSCYLTAYNLRPIFQPFMKTLDDLLQANIKVLISSQILEQLRNNKKYVNLTRLEPVLQEMTQHEVKHHINNFRRSFAFVVTQNDWMFTSKLQRKLIQPLYQLSQVCYGNIFNTFPIQLESKFAKSLDYFILLVQQSGLWVHWQEEAFMAAINTKYYDILKDEYPVDPLNLRYYKIAWFIFIGGMVISTICLIVEILVNIYKIKKLKINFTN